MDNIRNKQMNSCLSDLRGSSSLSAFKYLPLMNLGWRLRLNQVGIFKYTNITLMKQNTKSIVDLVSVRNKSVNDSNNIIPVIAEARITFRSLLKNFDIIFFNYKFYKHIRSISHKLIKLSLILSLSLIFYSNLGFAVAKNECLSEISKYEKIYKIPSGLLKAISKIESEYNHLALNDGLKQHRFKNTEEVLERINYLQEIGRSNFDIGCMQINYYWHKNNFDSVEDMIDTKKNVRYAASLLYGLFKTHGTWQDAVRHYHSSDPAIHKGYSKKIALAWLKEDRI